MRGRAFPGECNDLIACMATFVPDSSCPQVRGAFRIDYTQVTEALVSSAKERTIRNATQICACAVGGAKVFVAFEYDHLGSVRCLYKGSKYVTFVSGSAASKMHPELSTAALEEKVKRYSKADIMALSQTDSTAVLSYRQEVCDLLYCPQGWIMVEASLGKGLSCSFRVPIFTTAEKGLAQLASMAMQNADLELFVRVGKWPWTRPNKWWR